MRAVAISVLPERHANPRIDAPQHRTRSSDRSRTDLRIDDPPSVLGEGCGRVHKVGNCAEPVEVSGTDVVKPEAACTKATRNLAAIAAEMSGEHVWCSVQQGMRGTSRNRRPDWNQESAPSRERSFVVLDMFEHIDADDRVEALGDQTFEKLRLRDVAALGSERPARESSLHLAHALGGHVDGTSTNRSRLDGRIEVCAMAAADVEHALAQYRRECDAIHA